MLWLAGFLSIFINLAANSADIDLFVKKIESITKCELVITSGHRTPKHNKEVGGVPNSYHLYDRARDLILKDKNCTTIKDLAKIACELKLNVIEYTNHLHIDNRKNPSCTKGRYKWQLKPTNNGPQNKIIIGPMKLHIMLE